LLLLLGEWGQVVKRQTYHLGIPGKIEKEGEGEAWRTAGTGPADAVGPGPVAAVGELVKHIAD
jgi:hypothetical protein